LLQTIERNQATGLCKHARAAPAFVNQELLELDGR